MGQDMHRETKPAIRPTQRSPLRVSWMALMGSLALAGCATVSEPTTAPVPTVQAQPDPLQNAVIHPGTEEDGIATIAYWASRYERQPHKAQNAVRYSEALRGLKSYDRALTLMRQAMAIHPAEPKVLGEYGKVLAAAGRGEEAIAMLERAAALDPVDWRLPSALGVALDQQTRHPEAQKQYRVALQLSPRNPAIMNNLGLSHALAGDLHEAELVLRQAAGRAEATSQVRDNLAMVLRLRGNLTEARSLATAQDVPELESAFAPKIRATLSQAPALRIPDAAQAPEPEAAPEAVPAAAPVPAPQPVPAPVEPKAAPVPAPAPTDPKPILPDTDKIFRELPSVQLEAPAEEPKPVPQHATAAPKTPLVNAPRIERVRATNEPRLIVPQFLTTPQSADAPALRGSGDAIPVSATEPAAE